MGRQRCDGDGRPETCRTLASAAPPIGGNNQPMWTVWGGGDEREGRLGDKTSDQAEVELIEWRSIDLNLIDFKLTFHPPQIGKRTTPYSACILGVRLHYQRHGEYGLKVRLEDKCIQYRGQYLEKGGLSHEAFTSFFVMF
jgi:hypothetical protein